MARLRTRRLRRRAPRVRQPPPPVRSLTGHGSARRRCVSARSAPPCSSRSCCIVARCSAGRGPRGGRRADHRARRDARSSALLKGAGYTPFACARDRLSPLVVVLDARSRDVLEGSGSCSSRSGSSWSRSRRSPGPIRATGLPTWMATVFGALYVVAPRRSSSGSGTRRRRCPAGSPLAALGAERGWILLLVLAVWAYDTGAYLVGKRFGRTQVPDPHLAVQDVSQGSSAGSSPPRSSSALMLWGARPEPAPRPRRSVR